MWLISLIAQLSYAKRMTNSIFKLLATRLSSYAQDYLSKDESTEAGPATEKETVRTSIRHHQTKSVL